MNFRNMHRRIALVFTPFLVVTALTGLVFRVGRNWFNMSSETGAVIRSIHEAKYLGAMLSPFYVLLVGLGLLLLAGSGLTMIRRRRSAGRVHAPRRDGRWLHRLLGLVVLIPLVVTALTGMGFRLTQSWLGWPKEQAQWLLDIHQGTYLFGKDYRLYYVLFIATGLLVLLTTGFRLLQFTVAPGNRHQPACPHRSGSAA